MVYRKGDIVVNFYEEAVSKQSESEFVKGHKHHGLTEADLKEVYALCGGKKRKPVEVPKEDTD